MTYRIAGLDPAPYRHLFAADDALLAAARARRVRAGADIGWPCRTALRDAAAGTRMLLVHHVSNDVAGPFRMAHAIFVGEEAAAAALHADHVPEMIARRTLGLRAFDAEGELIDAALALPGEADGAIRVLMADASVARLHIHNAAHGCFLAAVERA